uniref:Uncharacterized protein n=1 Tax=Balaenoptera musculus TaxID=9771 RepID=A0A8C0I2Q7_BALMU
MENSKTYDSFQHELQDYIRKQRARGLQPEVCFIKGTEDSVYREKNHTAPRPPMLAQRFPFRRPHRSPSSYKRPKTVERHLPTLSNIHHFRQRLEPVNHCQKKHDHFFNNRWFPSPPKGGRGHGDEEQVSWKRKVAPGSTEKSKYRKKSTHDWDTMKEGRRSSREKKHPGKDSTQEWDLWDEAILGGSY